MRRALGLAVSIGLLASALLVTAPAQAATCRTDVFPSTFAAALARNFPDQRATAAVFDTRTGCWYYLNPSLRLTTASVIKAGILGAALYRAQQQGRRLTAREAGLASPMIRLSHNPPTSTLFSDLGGVAAMDAMDRRLGMTQTRNSSAWGATLTSARDRTMLAVKLLHGRGPFGGQARADAWAYMSTVHPTQRWGISAGVTSGMEVALKNGFYPMRGNGWRLGSTGFVRIAGSNQGYAISILTDRNADHFAGQHLVEVISRRVASKLAIAGTVAPRPVDRSVCTRTRSGESWGAVAVRLGLPSSRAADVRNVSGGNSSPLQGQRGCSPTLRS